MASKKKKKNDNDNKAKDMIVYQLFGATGKEKWRLLLCLLGASLFLKIKGALLIYFSLYQRNLIPRHLHKRALLYSNEATQ